MSKTQVKTSKANLDKFLKSGKDLEIDYTHAEMKELEKLSLADLLEIFTVNKINQKGGI